MENHFYHIKLPPLNVTIFIRHVHSLRNGCQANEYTNLFCWLISLFHQNINRINQYIAEHLIIEPWSCVTLYHVKHLIVRWWNSYERWTGLFCAHTKGFIWYLQFLTHVKKILLPSFKFFTLITSQFIGWHAALCGLQCSDLRGKCRCASEWG